MGPDGGTEKESRRIVRENPGEDGVLAQVVEAAARERVERHEVLKVRDRASLPQIAPQQRRGSAMSWQQLGLAYCKILASTKARRAAANS